MKVRRLNDDGIARFAEFLSSLTDQSPQPYPAELLTDDRFTEVVQPPIEIERGKCRDRLGLAKFFFDLFGESRIARIERDRGLWSWLALFFFPELCPTDRDGRWRPGEQGRWILQTWRNRYYIHLLAGPFCVYCAHKNRTHVVHAVLSGPANRFSDFYLELAKRQEIITNPAMVEAATRLYFDASAGRPRRRISRDAPGGVRRFVEVLAQFDCTWDLYSMTADDILALLPQEFDRFKASAREAGPCGRPPG